MTERMPFGLKIAVINREFRRRMDEKAADMGLTWAQLRVLGSVSRLEAAGKEEIHQNDLERIEHVTHPAMTRMLQRLEHKGLVRCEPSETHRRYKKISCTPRSAGIHEQLLAQDREVLEELCQALTPRQKELLEETIGLILDHIELERAFHSGKVNSQAVC